MKVAPNASTHPPLLDHRIRSKRRLWEVIAIMAILLIVGSFVPALKGFIALLTIVYYAIEGKIRKEPGNSFSTKIKQLPRDIAKNWYWILLVAVVFQLATVLFTKYGMPDLATHIRDRLPVSGFTIPTIIVLLIGPLGEEIAFRGLFQERLSWVMSPALSITLSTVCFAIMHFSSGSPLQVTVDLIGVALDGMVFGIIYHRTKNIWASWVAHALGDLIGMYLLVAFFS